MVSVDVKQQRTLFDQSSGGVQVQMVVPNSPYGLCGRKATLNSVWPEFRSCVKVEVAVQGSPSLSPCGLCGHKAVHWTWTWILFLILWCPGLKTMLTISFRASYWSILYYLVHTMITSIGSARVVSWAVYRDVIIINCCVWYFNLIIWIILPCDKQNKYVIISSLLFYDDVTVCSIFITMVKVRAFCWWCCVCCCIVFFNFMYSLFYEPAMTATTKLALGG